jgi:hypothetical protein
MGWLRNGILGWFVLSLAWGLATIVYDVYLEFWVGNANTISWETQQISKDNPVIPGAIGLVVFGLAVHFWKVREWSWFDPRQPLWYWLVCGLLGATFVALTWTQRG